MLVVLVWQRSKQLFPTRHARCVVRVVTSVTRLSCVSRHACSNMADNEEAVVLARTSLVFCALDLHQSQQQHLLPSPRCVDAPEHVSCESRLS